MLKPDHPNYGLKSCGYCGKILEPGHTLRSSGTCSETCETKREILGVIPLEEMYQADALCPVCKTMFLLNHHWQIYCSKDCKKKGLES
jgi:hypothetical protein